VPDTLNLCSPWPAAAHFFILLFFLKFVSLKEQTMENVLLYAQIAALPDALKEEVSDFVAFLSQKNKKTSEKNEKGIKERQFGCGKGYFIMSPDFDEPLEDFKDYM
jgi:hypothetical protein